MKIIETITKLVQLNPNQENVGLHPDTTYCGRVSPMIMLEKPTEDGLGLFGLAIIDVFGKYKIELLAGDKEFPNRTAETLQYRKRHAFNTTEQRAFKYNSYTNEIKSEAAYRSVDSQPAIFLPVLALKRYLYRHEVDSRLSAMEQTLSMVEFAASDPILNPDLAVRWAEPTKDN